LVDEMQRRDFPRLVEFLNEHSVERLFIPFAGLQQLAEAAVDQGVVPRSLRELNTAGEQLQITPQIVALLSRMEDCVVWNQYGPTEAQVVTAYKLDGPPSSWPVLPPIGVPVFNTQIHVLDARGNHVPVGVPGELLIGGDCLARGYLDQPELTAEKFVRHQGDGQEASRLYRTGDVARYRADGYIEYLGRVDSQVKIRGFRVELGEVEAVLTESPAVAEAAAVLREDAPNAKRLVAYVVLRAGQSGEVEEIRRFVARKLPDYMVPSRIEVIEALPLTSSGKVNRRALPAPSRNRTGPADSYVAPRTAVEEVVAGIWAEALVVERVGVNDNFFSSGGHSLLATQVVSRIRSALGMEIPVRSLFEYPTVAELAERIEAVQWAARSEERSTVTVGAEREGGRI
jgi:acyl-coenzyme A synthetase/AMP-(fatty) acid ligase/acyl carrier protein